VVLAWRPGPHRPETLNKTKMKAPPMTAQEAVRNALKWVLEDFQQTDNLYRDYQEVEGFTDDEYDEMLKALRRLASQPE
jgi:hypothetical protein